jgi:hypothetical protein
MAQKDR